MTSGFWVRDYQSAGGGRRVELGSLAWPAEITITDELLDEHDESYMQVRGPWVWFTFDNAVAQYRIRTRNEHLWSSTFDLVDGDREPWW